jgi:hypothetical protein
MDPFVAIQNIGSVAVYEMEKSRVGGDTVVEELAKVTTNLDNSIKECIRLTDASPCLFNMKEGQRAGACFVCSRGDGKELA